MKGQMSIQGIIYGFVTLLVLVALTPALYTFVGYVQSNATAVGDTTTAVIAGLIIPMMYIGVLLIPVVYSVFTGGNRQEQG